MKNMKRAERRRRTERKVAERRYFVDIMFASFWPPDRLEQFDIQKKIGQCRTRHPHDCGHTQCYCCHSDKLDDIPDRRTVESAMRLREGIEDAGARRGR